jgi:hypothetical protein
VTLSHEYNSQCTTGFGTVEKQNALTEYETVEKQNALKKDRGLKTILSAGTVSTNMMIS